MSDTVKWSFSADRCLRRCQRQFFLQHVAASHSANDTVRREAFLLKQIKTPELWHGSLVHRGIELYVVPGLSASEPIDWARAAELTAGMARRQFDFSANRRYREPGMTKAKAGDDYCALRAHELDDGVDQEDCDTAIGVIEQSFSNLADMSEVLVEIRGRGKYWPELEVRITYDAAFIEAHIDLLFFRAFGKPTIVDWKISDSQGGSDASLQTALYAWMLCQHPSWKVSRAEDCELLEVQLLTKTLRRHRVDQAVFDRLEDRIYRSVDGMKALGIGEKFDIVNIERFDFAANANSCAFCSMQPLCRRLLTEPALTEEPSTKNRPRGKRKQAHVYAHLSCFEIENVASLRMEYRLVNLDGPFDPNLGDGDLAERNLQQLLKRVQYEERIPAAVVRIGQEPRLAIPANHVLKRTEYELTPDVATLTLQNEVLPLSFAPGGSDRIGLAFLGWYLRTPLYNQDGLWSSGPSTYLSKRPLNYRQDNREIDVFRGFGFRLGWVGNRLCVWVKLAHRYAESSWLLDGYEPAAIEQKLRMRHMLYHYGHRWFPVQLLGLTGKSIKDQTFIPDGARDPINIYDYTLREASGHRPPVWIQSLDPDSAAIAFRYIGNEKKRHGAAALCKLLVQTEDPRVGAVHRMSIVDPQARFAELRRVAETYLSRATFGETPIRLRSAPLQVEAKWFSVPAQEFGQGKILRIGRNGVAGEVPLTQFARKRWDFLLDPEGGFAVNGSLDAQYIIVPESLERSIAKDFQDRLEKTVRRLAKRSYGFTRVVYADRDTRTLKRQVDSITDALHRANVQSGRALLVLPGHAHSDLHNLLKRKLARSLHFQAVDAGKVAGFYEPHTNNGRTECAVAEERAKLYVSYLRYTAMGLMLVNRQWPWVLPEGTHYDMYIALDVLNHTAAFTFFSQGGRQCYVETVESQQSEKLLRQQVRSVVYETLRNQLRQGGHAPRSIVLRRDGKAYRCEWFGLRDAVEQLKRDGLLPQDVLYGIVEVHKTNAEGVRLAEECRDETLRNPTIGTWEILNPKVGVVCTTGFPFRLNGTANPLLVRIVAGDLNLPYVLEDTFDMSQLCWPVPDRFIRLSIDLNLCDETLRSVACAAEDDEGQFGEEEADDGATDERHAVGWNP